MEIRINILETQLEVIPISHYKDEDQLQQGIEPAGVFSPHVAVKWHRNLNS
jgi:hypothetical protein